MGCLLHRDPSQGLPLVSATALLARCAAQLCSPAGWLCLAQAGTPAPGTGSSPRTPSCCPPPRSRLACGQAGRLCPLSGWLGAIPSSAQHITASFTPEVAVGRLGFLRGLLVTASSPPPPQDMASRRFLAARGSIGRSSSCSRILRSSQE